MNLHRAIVNEEAGEQNVVLTLDEIIRDGKVTNPYQNFILGWLSEHFRLAAGAQHRSGIPPASPGLRNPGELGATSTEIVESIKALTPEEAVQLAQFLRECVLFSEKLPWGVNLCAVDWIHYVLKHQD